LRRVREPWLTITEGYEEESFVCLFNQPDEFDSARGSFVPSSPRSLTRAVDVVRSQNARRSLESKDAAKSARDGYDIQIFKIPLTIGKIFIAAGLF